MKPIVTAPGDVKAIRLDHLRLPIHIVIGRYEAATEEELRDLITDLEHELTRREPGGTA